jgi:hypothetical protein
MNKWANADKPQFGFSRAEDIPLVQDCPSEARDLQKTVSDESCLRFFVFLC